MQYDAILFDLDGTLTDSQEGIRNCAKYALQKMNLPIPNDETLQKFMGPPLADSFINFCGMTEAQAIRATDFYRERYIPTGWRENDVFPGIRSLLRTLKAQGVYLAVATGKPEKTSVRILDYFGLLPYFDKVAGPLDTDLHADKGDLIRRVLPAGKKALMVGDTPGDIQGALDTRIDSCAAFWGYGDKEKMLSLHPTMTATDVFDLTRQLIGELPRKGFFITIEGIDGCGKTTQLEYLMENLRHFGYLTHRTREPGGCPIAESIRQIVLSKEDGGMCNETEALLFAAARAQHVHEVILPKVRSGHVVVCDRFVDSSLVYQGMGRGLDPAWVRTINQPALSIGAPDMTLYLKMNWQEALKRRTDSSTPDRIEKSSAAFFEKAANAYDLLAEEDQERYCVIDAEGDKEKIAQALWARVFEKLREAQV